MEICARGYGKERMSQSQNGNGNAIETYVI